ncbi:MAG: S-layer homology domain-containing protein [Defluviitaleaceae bacterium]|nr:S-layer homology domain-containing protein [Defluviitaleaceae bacterium]
MKICLCLSLVIALLCGSVSPWVTPRPFARSATVTQLLEGQAGYVITDSWAAAYVDRAASLGFVPPTFTDLTLPITRAEFTDLAVRLYENLTGTEITGQVSFNDTNDLNVQKMGYLGVVFGVGGGYFNPYGIITREQAAVMLVRLFDIFTPAELTYNLD